MRWAFGRATRVIAVSEPLRKLAVSLGAEPAKVATIPNGVDPQGFSRGNRERIRASLGIEPEMKVILCAGELVRNKGHHLVVASLKRVVEEGIDARLWIAGGRGRDDTSYESPIRSLVSRLGIDERVTFMGFVQRQRLAELMSAADLFCLPSSQEGWPNVVHEALACGVPVVATRVGGVPELIPRDRYGFIVEVQDQDALDEAILKALQKHWDHNLIAAWGQSRTWEHVAAEVLDLFHEAVNTEIHLQRCLVSQASVRCAEDSPGQNRD